MSAADFDKGDYVYYEPGERRPSPAAHKKHWHAALLAGAASLGITLGTPMSRGIVEPISNFANPVASENFERPTLMQQINAWDDFHIKWANYWQAQRSDAVNSLDREIDACRIMGTHCNPRVRAWVDLIDDVKKIEDPLKKLEIVNGWVNTMISYDYDEGAYVDGVNAGASLKHLKKEPLFRTPYDTLVGGKATCIGYTLLKYETLARAGFPAGDLQMIAGNEIEFSAGRNFGGGEHAVLLATVGKSRYVLDSLLAETPPAQAMQSSPHYDSRVQRLMTFSENAALTPVKTPGPTAYNVLEDPWGPGTWTETFTQNATYRTDGTIDPLDMQISNTQLAQQKPGFRQLHSALKDLYSYLHVRKAFRVHASAASLSGVIADAFTMNLAAPNARPSVTVTVQPMRPLKQARAESPPGPPRG